MYKRIIVNNLIKQAGIIKDLIGGTGSLAGRTRDGIIIAGDNTESGMENAGYTLGQLISTPDKDNDDLGPFKDVVQHIKDTELAEAYLREAAAMRRKSRILKRKRDEEKSLRNSIASSRFF